MSKIEWTEKTWNPSIGCNKVSSGCKNCYAEVMAKRLQAMGVKDYEDGFKFKELESRLGLPLKIKKSTVFFVNSMSDLFHEDISVDFLDKVFETMRKTPRHIYQVLTKRPEKMLDYCKKIEIPKNVFLGVTVESRFVKSRIDVLRKLNCNNFLSLEPLLDDLEEINLKGIGWVIVGGESGANARPMKKEWVANIFNQCQENKVPFFFKQWGAWNDEGVKKNKKVNGRLFLEKEWNEKPQAMVL